MANFHPDGRYAKWPEITKECFDELKPLYDEHMEGKYKGNAAIALAEIARKHKVTNPDYFAWWLTTVCHTFEWVEGKKLEFLLATGKAK